MFMRRSAVIAAAVLLVCACAQTGHETQPPPGPPPPSPIPVAAPVAPPVNAAQAMRIERGNLDRAVMAQAKAAKAEAYVDEAGVPAAADVLGAGRYAPFVQ